jgi:hypothetical protein
MKADYDQAGKLKPQCYGSGWDGDLFSTFQAETDLKVALAMIVSQDAHSARVRATMDVTIDDGRHFKPEQTFVLVAEKGQWKIDEIEFENGSAIHAFFRRMVSRCKR